ncbi:hypothetical protein L1085_019365 [Streptomyces sp. MSC1_001]|jgi:hypothetical protein|uniref:hypothetical protein n=1 Tax=Streptomyces sp. MSC1_001 TaxID=2909263 RepID=UPI00202F9080|nr:hypothetical protein [Streptomyces sp. MSC1_001]
MQHHRTARSPYVAAGLALLCLTAVGCTDGPHPSDTATASAPGKPMGEPSGTPSPRGEEEQGRRAEAALETGWPDDPEFVESGLERVRDGVHHLSPLTPGRTYRLSVVCVGTGTVKVVVADKDPRTVPCDGVPAARRVEKAPERLPIDITPATGATGMVAWRIVSLPT